MADLEQLFHDLEQRHVALKKEFDVVVVDRDSLRGKKNLLLKLMKNHRLCFYFFVIFQIMQKN